MKIVEILEIGGKIGIILPKMFLYFTFTYCYWYKPQDEMEKWNYFYAWIVCLGMAGIIEAIDRLREDKKDK